MRILLLFVVGVLLAALPGGTVTADGAPASCRFAGARTIASSALARVVQRSGVTYGCMYSVNRRVVLGTYENTASSTIEQRNVRLAGRYVAFGETKIGKEYIGFIVRVFDLRSGKPVSLSETGPPTQRAKDETSATPLAWDQLCPSGCVRRATSPGSLRCSTPTATRATRSESARVAAPPFSAGQSASIQVRSGSSDRG